jgi:UDP-apiose/xylose synthase
MPDSSRHVCLLGGGGFLGSHLVQALLGRTSGELTVIDTALDKVEPFACDRLRLQRASIAEPGVVERALDSADVVLSLTALCNPSLYNTRPREVIAANFSDLVPVVERCAARRRRLIHFSTCEVYGKTVPEGEAALDEEQSPLQLGPIHRERWTYACAKQLLERLIWALGAHSELEFAIVRPFNVIGARMDFIPGVDGEGVPRVLACFIGALLAGEPLRLVDGGAQRRSFVDTTDFCDAVLRIIERPDAARGQVFNVGNPANDVTIAELAERLAALYRARRGGPPPALVSVSAAELYGPGYDDVIRRIPGISKARRLLGWEPRVSLQQMLPAILDDYLARYGAGRGERR